MSRRETTLFGRRMGYNERRRKERRTKKIRCSILGAWRWFRRRGWILCVIIFALGLLAFNNRFYLQRFNPLELRYLQSVEIEGNRMLSWEDVMQAAQIETGMPMKELNADSVENSLEELPLIVNANVQKKFPNSLQIQLQEASPLFTVLENGKATIYSEKGFTLPYSVATAMKLPVLDGESIDQVELVSRFLEAMKICDKNLYEKVSQIAWSKKDDCLKVYLSDMNFTLLFPKKDWDKEMFTLYKALEVGFVKDLHCAGEVDLRFNGFAYVRKYEKRCENG